MPELPDITVYIEALERRIVGQSLVRTELLSPFLLRTAEPPLVELVGHVVTRIARLGKRICLYFEHGPVLVMHLMIAGRLQWRDDNRGKGARNVQARLYFDNGTVSFTEAGNKKRAAWHVLANADAVAEMDPGGIEIGGCDLETFAARLTRSNHTLKRALTDPRLFSGIGNAYSDEILHGAGLSPVKQTQKLADDDITRLFHAVNDTITRWTERLRQATGDKFPAKVTAFHEDMAVHGRYGQPCPACRTTVQRIRYADNELNYCPRCQTDGKLLADRALSRLLKKDWPKTVEALENSE